MCILWAFANGFQLYKTVFLKTVVLSKGKAKNWLLDRYGFSDGASFVALGTSNLIYVYSDVLVKSNLL